MNVQAISAAILELADEKEKCQEMGEIGYKRLYNKYLIEMMINRYREIYYK